MSYVKWWLRAAAVLAAMAPVGQARAQSPATCSFNLATATVAVAVDQTEAVLTRTAAGVIRLGGAACNGATVFNTDTIVITGGAALDRVSINGDFAPGRTPDLGRSEIEFTLSNIEKFTLVLGDGDDVVVATETGVDIGGDLDTDITGLTPQIVHGEGGDDVIDMTLAPVGTLYGEAGDDILLGGHIVFAGEGNDFIEGGDGHDRLDGGPGDDVMLGGDGNDTFLIGAVVDGADRIDGGGGKDLVDYSQRTADITVTNSAGGADDGEVDEGDEISRVERVITGGGNDFIIGTNGEDAIESGDGDDQISAGGSTDIVEAGPGDDTIEGGEGRNTLDAGDGNDVIISSSPSDDRILAGAGDDEIIGNADGNLDNVNCGLGTDTAEADPKDVFVSCEVLQ
jgi:Ca2+-binding RTX toxin-like protein